MAYTYQNAILGQIQMSDLISLTDDDGTGEVNTGILNTIITAADDKINAAIANIYQVPVSPISPPVTSWSLTITCYMLYRRRLVPDEKNNFSSDYHEVMALLKMVNDGTYHLNLTELRDFSQVAYTATNTPYGVVGSNQPATSM